MPKKRDPIALKYLQVEEVLLVELKPNEYNPNRQTEDEFEMLKASIREDGFTQPILCMSDGTIVDGEHRWRAAQELGYETVPVVRVSMTEAQRRIATMRHNRARGQDDTAAVAELMLDLEKLGASEWAQEALLLSDEEMRRLVAMADTVAEDLSRGHEFSQAWEPVERTTYQPPDKPGMPVSYSRPVTPIVQASNGLGAGVPSRNTLEATDPEPMTRRQFVITLSEAAIVDRVLGKQAAARLVALCQEAEKHGW
jgi:ParB/RepB/Spo0J family partition protein